MELRHLRYFVAVAEEENFHRAAEKLHVSQSPLSRQLQQLRAEIGVDLFEPSGRGVKLTLAGRLFLERLRQAGPSARWRGAGFAGVFRVPAEPVFVGFAGVRPRSRLGWIGLGCFFCRVLSFSTDS